MDLPVTYQEAKAFIGTLALTQPRILAMFIALPLFNTQLVPGLLRFSVAAALGVVMVPALSAEVAVADLGALQLLLLVLKEAFVGFVIGYLAAIPFWIFEAVGFLVDNQRGASIASTLNPLTGNDSSPLGILFNQAFIVFFLITGGFTLLLGVLYAAALFAIMLVASDDGKLSELIAANQGQITEETMKDPAMQEAVRNAMGNMLLASILYLPVSILFWHSPALVHWSLPPRPCHR